MTKILNPNILTAALVIIVSGLLGQYAAHGISPLQWISGLAAVAGAVSLAVIVRTWPKTEAGRVEG